jgi:divalent metal cation (Fe/Co/Zn/Cd) transporter
MSELLSALTLRLQSSGERAMLTVLGYLAATLLILVALGAFAYAGATAISQVYGPVVAALSVAVGALVVALIIVLWLYQRQRRLARQLRMRRTLQPSVVNAATTVLPVLLKASPLGTLAAVAAAAYVISKASQRND